MNASQRSLSWSMCKKRRRRKNGLEPWLDQGKVLQSEHGAPSQSEGIHRDRKKKEDFSDFISFPPTALYLTLDSDESYCGVT